MTNDKKHTTPVAKTPEYGLADAIQGAVDNSLFFRLNVSAMKVVLLGGGIVAFLLGSLCRLFS